MWVLLVLFPLLLLRHQLTFRVDTYLRRMSPISHLFNLHSSFTSIIIIFRWASQIQSLPQFELMIIIIIKITIIYVYEQWTYLNLAARKKKKKRNVCNNSNMVYSKYLCIKRRLDLIRLNRSNTILIRLECAILPLPPIINNIIFNACIMYWASNTKYQAPSSDIFLCNFVFGCCCFRYFFFIFY